jgi:hypothetical protein
LEEEFSSNVQPDLRRAARFVSPDFFSGSTKPAPIHGRRFAPKLFFAIFLSKIACQAPNRFNSLKPNEIELAC